MSADNDLEAARVLATEYTNLHRTIQGMAVAEDHDPRWGPADTKRLDDLQGQHGTLRVRLTELLAAFVRNHPAAWHAFLATSVTRLQLLARHDGGARYVSYESDEWTRWSNGQPPDDPAEIFARGVRVLAEYKNEIDLLVRDKGKQTLSCAGMVVHYPPAPWRSEPATRTVFLAGSIEMGAAEDWQARLIATLASSDLGKDVVALNPRRAAWDSSWRQSIDEPQFREQVEWELDGLERADVIVMWLAPETKAPISLLELGLFARSNKVIVGCPDGYWRKGNVEVVAARYGCKLAGDWESFVREIQKALSRVPGI